jgi:beta-lactamase class A
VYQEFLSILHPKKNMSHHSFCKFALFFALQTGFWTIGAAQTGSISGLEIKIRALIAQADSGFYAVAYRDLAEPSKCVFIEENEVFHAASTMKTPVMVEVFKNVSQGKINLTDSLVIHNRFRSIVDGSEFAIEINEDSNEKYLELIGQKATVYDLCFEMITKSSNHCTNILIDLVGAKNVTQTMEAIGAEGIQVLRGLFDMKAYDLGMNNTTTAKALLTVFETLGRRELINAEASEQMLRILESQHYGDIIPKYLPEEVKIANKTGSISTAMHDSALIQLPDGRKYALVLLSKNWGDEDKAKELMATISKMIYDSYFD